jgi:hypothetical protein
MEKPNREQRRREKFGRAGKVHQHDPLDPWPDSEANPALKTVVDQVAPTPEPVKDEPLEGKAAPAKPASTKKPSPAKKASPQAKTAKA